MIYCLIAFIAIAIVNAIKLGILWDQIEIPWSPLLSVSISIAMIAGIIAQIWSKV